MRPLNLMPSIVVGRSEVCVEVRIEPGHGTARAARTASIIAEASAGKRPIVQLVHREGARRQQHPHRGRSARDVTLRGEFRDTAAQLAETGG